MYKIDTIESVESLNPGSSKPWFRYIISNESNSITGYRSGSKKEIRRFVNACTANLNRKYPPIKMRTINPAQINISYLSQITHGLFR